MSRKNLKLPFSSENGKEERKLGGQLWREIFKIAWARFGSKLAQPGKRDLFAKGLIQIRLGQLEEEGEGRMEQRRRHPMMISHDHHTGHDLEV